jgi:dienelactone hydrolase
MNRLVLQILVIAVSLPAFADSKTINYTVGGKKHAGYLSYNSNIKGKRPGVIVAPEWWGISAHEKGVADKLAALGYTALVLDLYGAGNSSFDPEKANEMMAAAEEDTKHLNSIFDKGVELLTKEPTVKPGQIAAIGYGFGGGVVLDQARWSKNLKLAVSYYGGLVNKDGRVPKKPIKAEILVFVGEFDQYVNAEQVAEFKEEMAGLKAKASVIVLKDAFPSFANKLAGEAGMKHQMPFKYDAAADKKSWDETVKALKRLLK